MKHAVIAVCCCIAMGLQAQNVGIGISSPNTNAKLDITATDKGLLIPRMDSVHRKAIPNTIGLLVYDSTTKSFWFNNGNAWQNMATSSGWSITGNSGINSAANFLGTTDDVPLVFKVNGLQAGRIGNGSVVLGVGALSINTGTSPGVVAIGNAALASNTHDGSVYLSGNANTAVGNASLTANTLGFDNTAVGYATLNATTTGQGNTVMGSQSMIFNVEGNNNIAIGKYSNYKNTSGSYNTAVGVDALYFNTTGNRNTAIGSEAGTSGYDFTNATAIGANANVNASNKVRLGDAAVTVVESNGVFNTVSDGRFKYNIQEDVKGLSFIMNLRPVTYQFDAKKQEDFSKGNLSAEQLNNPVIPAAFNESNGIKRTGFIAQEVEKAAQKTGYDFDGVKIPVTDKQYYSLSYASFVVPLVKAVQEQQETIELLKKQNDMLLKRLEALENKNR